MPNNAERIRLLLGRAYQDLGVFHSRVSTPYQRECGAKNALFDAERAIPLLRELVRVLDTNHPDHDCERCSDDYLALEGAVVGILLRVP